MKVLCTLLIVLLVSCTIIHQTHAQMMGMDPRSLMMMLGMFSGSDRMRNMMMMNMLFGGGMMGGGGGGGGGMAGMGGMMGLPMMMAMGGM